MEGVKKIKVEISPKSIVLVIGICILTYFLFMIRNIIAMVFIAFIISAAFSPAIKFLTDKKIPKWLAITLIYVLAFSLILFVISLVSVPIAKEIVKLLNNFPNAIAKIFENLKSIGLESEVIGTETMEESLSTWTKSISQNLGNLISAGANGISGVAHILTNLFGGLISLISIIAMAIYISIDKDNFYSVILLKIADKKVQDNIRNLLNKIESALSSWIVGQTILSFIIGTLAITSYTIIGLPYAGSLALLTALLNIIPNLGPVIAFIPAFIISLSTGNPVTIVGSIVVSIIIQQLEGNIIAPKILSNAVGLPPLLILISLLIGAQLFGIVGIILAVPVAVIFHLVLNYLSNKD